MTRVLRAGSFYTIVASLVTCLVAGPVRAQGGTGSGTGAGATSAAGTSDGQLGTPAPQNDEGGFNPGWLGLLGLLGLAGLRRRTEATVRDTTATTGRRV